MLVFSRHHFKEIDISICSLAIAKLQLTQSGGINAFLEFSDDFVPHVSRASSHGNNFLSKDRHSQSSVCHVNTISLCFLSSYNLDRPEPSRGATRRCFPANGGYNSHMSGPSDPYRAASCGAILSHINNKSVSMYIWPLSCLASTPVARGTTWMVTSADIRSSRA